MLADDSAWDTGVEVVSDWGSLLVVGVGCVGVDCEGVTVVTAWVEVGGGLVNGEPFFCPA